MRLPQDADRQTSSHSGLWLNLLIISGTWGSSFLFTKLVSESLPPFAFAATRGFIAMAALLVWLTIRPRSVNVVTAVGQRSGVRKNLGHAVVLGTTNGWLTNALTVVAVARVDSAIAAMLQATVPLIVAVLAHLLFKEERLSLSQATGILTGLAGILLIIGPIAVFGGHGSLVGIGAMLATALSYALGTVYGRHVAPRDPAALACGQQACGAAIASLISFAIEPTVVWHQPTRIWVLLGILGVLCSAVPTVFYLRLLARTTSVPAALVAYLQPVWASLLGWAVLGELISPQAVIGTCLVTIGIMVSTRTALAPARLL